MQHEIKRLILFPDEANLVGNCSVESVALTIENYKIVFLQSALIEHSMARRCMGSASLFCSE